MSSSAAAFLQKYQRKPVGATISQPIVEAPSAASPDSTLITLLGSMPMLGTFRAQAISVPETTDSGSIATPLKIDFAMGIGCDCASAAALRFAKLRPCSLPLDWIRSTPESTRRMIMLCETIPRRHHTDPTTTTNTADDAEPKPSSHLSRSEYFKAFHPTVFAAINDNKKEGSGVADDEGPDPLMAPCDSDADDDGGTTVISSNVHKIASNKDDADSVSWTMSCPLFDGLDAACRAARLRSMANSPNSNDNAATATPPPLVAVASDTLPVYHRMDTQQYYTTPLRDATATNVHGSSSAGPPREPQETFYFDRNFGLIASKEEALNAQRRMVRVHWSLREIRKLLTQDPLGDESPLRALLLCTGRVVGDCPEITARVNGEPLVTSNFTSSSDVTNENAQLIQEALSVAEAVLTIVAPPPQTQLRRPLEVHLVLVNVGMVEESLRLECSGKAGGCTVSVIIHKQFLGYPSAAKPWANVGALTSEVLTKLYRI